LVSQNKGDRPVSLSSGDVTPIRRFTNFYNLDGSKVDLSKDPISPLFLKTKDPIIKNNTIGETRGISRPLIKDNNDFNYNVESLVERNNITDIAQKSLVDSMKNRLESMKSGSLPESGQIITESKETPNESQVEPQVIVSKNKDGNDKFYKTNENFRRDLYEHLLNQANKRTLEVKNKLYRDDIVPQPMTFDPNKINQQIANQNITNINSADQHANIIQSTAQQANTNDFREKTLSNIQDQLSKAYLYQTDAINKNNRNRLNFENDLIDAKNIAAQANFEEQKMNDAERVKLMVDAAYGNEYDNQINDLNAQNQAALEIQQYTQSYVNNKIKEYAEKLEKSTKEKNEILKNYQNDIAKATTDEEREKIVERYRPLLEKANQDYDDANKNYEENKKRWEQQAQLLFSQYMQERQMNLRGRRPGEGMIPVTSYKKEGAGVLNSMGVETYKEGGLTLEQLKDLESHKSKLRMLEKKNKKEMTVQDKVYLKEREQALKLERSRQENSLKRINSLLNKLANIR
jgi:hypothetical protein